MKMFKSIRTWMACAAMLSSGLMAQEAPKANPIEVKEQNGEVLGSLEQADNKWIPSININAGFQSKFFSRGLMQDKNPHASIDVSLIWMPTENSRLSIGINGNAPTRNSRKFLRVQRIIPGNQKIDETGKPVTFDYYENDLAYLYELLNQDSLNVDSEKYSSLFQKKSVPIYENIVSVENINYSSMREKNEFDERKINIEYTYTFKDVPFIGDVSISGGFTSIRDNEIYSEFRHRGVFADYSLILTEQSNTQVRGLSESDESSNLNSYHVNNVVTPSPRTGSSPSSSIVSRLKPLGTGIKTAVNRYKNLLGTRSEDDDSADDLAILEYLQELVQNDPNFDPELTALLNNIEDLTALWKELGESIPLLGDYSTMYNYKLKVRDQRREELNLGLSLDNILESNTLILNPNMSFNFETSGHVWMQYGLNFSMPLDVISRKLTWDTSLDTYWFDHDYFKVSEYISFYVVDKEGKFDQTKTEELMKISSSYQGRKEVSHSPSGFKTFTARTSLNYAIRPNITISPNVSAVHRIDILDHKAANNRFFEQNDFVWCGINLNYSF